MRVGVYEQVHVRVSVCVSESTKDVNFKKSSCAHEDKVRGPSIRLTQKVIRFTHW